MNKNNRTQIILHGHFYQPPRENPLTGIIPKQDSARPFLDWNERILNECYLTNTQARYLDYQGRVLSITNNFEYISFNFGPTLLSWIESYHKDVHDKIVEADKKSIERLGHGNAMAQGFNHTILPLDSEDDARMQIYWGIKDFESRFERKPEGMWLPEAAINTKIVDILSEEGIKFVVLSPWQCKAIENNNGEMVDLNGRKPPCDTPFILEGEKGNKISAFFYNPELAEGISFGHLLRDADNLYRRIINIRNNENPKLIHTATDGEIYGHHEPFGDMALAALIKKVKERDDFEFTNYATFLAQNPPTRKAVLHSGEENKGTSWSCSHGVSRWFKDCGCHTGGEPGWNQQWRTPLREALKNNAARLDLIFKDRIKEIFKDDLSSYQLLRQFSSVASQKMKMIDFINDLKKDHPLCKGYETEVASLLEGMKNKYFSFTSCGWFFNDLAGLEPIQNINYALYAINLFQKYCSKSLIAPFLRDLKLAKSNIAKEGNGMSIAQNLLEELPGEVEASIYFILNRKIAPSTFFTDKHGRFKLTYFDSNEENPKLNIFDTISLRSYKTDAIISKTNRGLEIYLSLKNNSDNSVNQYKLSHNNIPARILEETYYWIEYSLSCVGDIKLKQIAKDIKNYSMIYKDNPNINIDTIYIENIGTCLRALRSLFIVPNNIPWSEKEESVKALIDFIMYQGRDKEIAKVKEIFNKTSAKLAKQIQEDGLSDDLLELILNFVKLSHDEHLDIDLRYLQNVFYPFMMEDKKRESLDLFKFTELKNNLNFA